MPHFIIFGELGKGWRVKGDRCRVKRQTYRITEIVGSRVKRQKYRNTEIVEIPHVVLFWERGGRGG